MVFITLKLIVFKKISEFFPTLLFMFFIVWVLFKSYYWLVPYLCLVSVLSENILTLLLSFVFKTDIKFLL